MSHTVFLIRSNDGLFWDGSGWSEDFDHACWSLDKELVLNTARSMVDVAAYEYDRLGNQIARCL